MAMYVSTPTISMSSKAPEQRIIGQLTLALHVTVACVALSITFILFDNTLFAWHPAFMVRFGLAYGLWGEGRRYGDMGDACRMGKKLPPRQIK